MKRSTFRKSSLISSVALLLVAIVALSGATFAWFTTGTQTQATGVNLTASSASGLYIVESSSSTLPDENAGWTGSIAFTDATLAAVAPVSADFSDPGSPTFVTTSTSNADGTYDGVATISGATAGVQYIAKSIWVKGDGTEATETLLAKLALGSAGYGYNRYAVVDVTGTATLVGGGVLGNAAETKACAPLLSNGTTGTAYQAVGAFTTNTNVKTDWNPSAGAHFMIYCWFEGQDADCKPALSGAELSLGIYFDLAKKNG